MSAPMPPRLYVILAREANKAVVIRRGPSEWTRLSLWHTDTDQVEHGQWLHARLYPERCDLSPDGSLFIYFAFHDNRANWQAKPEEYTGIYTAISRPPYFKALALWSGHDTWGGGGKFLDNRRVYVSAAPETHPNHPMPRALKRVEHAEATMEGDRFRGFGAYRGWHPIDPNIDERTLGQLWQQGKPYEFYRDQPDGKTRLEGRWTIGDQSRQRQYRMFSVKRMPSGEPILIKGHTTWADWDHKGRLVCAVDGALYALDPTDPNGNRTLIADFNGQTFEPILAPEWASR